MTRTYTAKQLLLVCVK